MGMARIGALQYESDTRSDDIRTILYLDKDTKHVIRSLPAFASVTQWDKKLAGVLMNSPLLIYLVYGRDKTFDMQSLKAYKLLKAYKFFL